MKTISQSDLRANLYQEMNGVVDNASPTMVVRAKGENLVIVSESDYSALLETLYLLQSPANAKRLEEANAQIDSGNAKPYDMSEFGL